MKFRDTKSRPDQTRQRSLVHGNRPSPSQRRPFVGVERNFFVGVIVGVGDVVVLFN